MRNQSSFMGSDLEPHNSNYSSPVPIIGLYIAGATLVCLLFIVLDIYDGFRNRKRWLPCRLFTFNSATLAILAVATKLPVDLTTSMPSALDQLSKLTGTTFICISMGFFMPSLGLTTKSECLSNMISLTIFVITAVVNVCIQMRTGVITSFKAEHIIVLCCMMLLLIELWFGAQDINFEKRYMAYGIKNYLAGSRGSLLQRLKVCYLYVYESNPQLLLCRKLVHSRTCGLCIVCAATLLEAIIRSSVSKDLEFRQGTSDYRWSMWAIIASQTIAVLVSCFGIAVRLLSMATHLNIDDDTITDLFEDISGDDSWLQSDLITLVCSPFSIILDLITVMFLVAPAFEKGIKCFRNVINLSDGTCITICNKHVDEDEVGDIAERMKVFYDESRQGHFYWGDFDDWTLKKGVKEMKRWIEMNKLKISSGLVELLRRTPVSLSNFAEYQNWLMRQLRQEYKVSPIVMVVLARIATIAIPSSLSQSIHDSLEEFFDVIHFTARRTSPKTIFSEYKHLKAAWTGTEYFKFVNKQKPEEFQSDENQLDRAIQIIKHVRENLSEAIKEFRQLKVVIILLEFIESKDYASIEDLFGDMEHIVISMLKELLGQLPYIIFEEIRESSDEKLEKKVIDALKFICKVEELEFLIPWSFPVGTTITSLVTDDATVGENTALESNCNAV